MCAGSFLIAWPVSSSHDEKGVPYWASRRRPRLQPPVLFKSSDSDFSSKRQATWPGLSHAINNKSLCGCCGVQHLHKGFEQEPARKGLVGEGGNPALCIGRDDPLRTFMDLRLLNSCRVNKIRIHVTIGATQTSV